MRKWQSWLGVKMILKSLVFNSSSEKLNFQDIDENTFSFYDLQLNVRKAISFLKSLDFSKYKTLGMIVSYNWKSFIWDIACQITGLTTMPIDRAYVLKNPYFLKILPVDFWLSDIDLPEINKISLNSYETYEPYFGKLLEKSADIFTYKITSGTTKDPKLLPCSSEHVFHMIEGIESIFPFKETGKLLISMPFSIFLQRILVYCAIRNNLEIVFTNPQRLVTYFQKCKPTIMIGVPHLLNSFYELYNKQTELGNKDSFQDFFGGKLECLWTGSSPISEKLLKIYADSNIPVYEGYGMTEVGMIAKNYPSKSKLNTVGSIFPGVQLRFDENNAIEVKIKHPPAKAYLNSNEVFPITEDDWIKTGDIGFLDNDGFLVLTGRIKETIILSNGKNIYPAMLEKQLLELDSICNVCVIGNSLPYLIAVIHPKKKTDYRNEILNYLRSINNLHAEFEKILFCIFTEEPFGEDNGFLNARLKLNRSAVENWAGKLSDKFLIKV